jgi:hypothetical protein
MKAWLMHSDRDLGPAHEPTAAERALTQDLELGVLWSAMAAGDDYLAGQVRQVMLASLTSPDTITYRQQILADAVAQPAVVRRLYDIAVAAVTGTRRGLFGLASTSPDSLVYRSAQTLEMFTGQLKQLRSVADEHGGRFRSEGFRRFFGMIAAELDDAYLRTVDDHLKELAFRKGTLISANLGPGHKGAGYRLRRPHEQGWRDRLPRGGPPGFGFAVLDRDEAGQAALSDLRSRGLNGVASALAQACDHLLAFFSMLRAELAFYVGGLNLRQALTAAGEPVCVPVPVPGSSTGDKLALSARGLYDPALSLRLAGRAVGNHVDADGKRLIMITGANQGGKSTFLRSVGLAQLMMQCGLFVAAESFTASVSQGVFTHFPREEDATMEHGKLDEELSRMSDLADQLRPGSLLLANESFAATNEQEGSEIGRQVVRALTGAGVRVVFVTHLFDLARSLYVTEGAQEENALFLRPERRDDGSRTFRLLPGEPRSTSYGPDLYRRIFGLSGPGLGDGGLTHDQLGLEHDLPVPVSLTVGGLLDQHLHGRLTQLGPGLAHRGQRHRGRGGEVDVVVADDGQIAGHRQAPAHGVLQQPQGQQVVGAERRGRPVPGRNGGQPLAGGPALFHVQPRRLDHGQRVRRQPGRFDGGVGPGQALADLGDRQRAADEADAPVPLVDQVRDGQFGADAVVHGHRALVAAGGPVDQDHRDAAAADLVDRGGPAPDRSDQDAERALLAQRAQVMVLAGGVVVAVAQHDRQAQGGRDPLGARGQVGEERVAHVQHDQADGAAAARPQLPGRFVADEAELIDGLQDTLARRRGHPLGPVQDVGDGTH